METVSNMTTENEPASKPYDGANTCAPAAPQPYALGWAEALLAEPLTVKVPRDLLADLTSLAGTVAYLRADLTRSVEAANSQSRHDQAVNDHLSDNLRTKDAEIADARAVADGMAETLARVKAERDDYAEAHGIVVSERTALQAEIAAVHQALATERTAHQATARSLIGAQEAERRLRDSLERSQASLVASRARVTELEDAEATRVVTLGPDDAEPAPRSVVIDRDGDAWVRHRTGWCLTAEGGSTPGRSTWDSLTSALAPLALVYLSDRE
jgi:hypothetical protein